MNSDVKIHHSYKIIRDASAAYFRNDLEDESITSNTPDRALNSTSINERCQPKPFTKEGPKQAGETEPSSQTLISAEQGQTSTALQAHSLHNTLPMGYTPGAPVLQQGTPLLSPRTHHYVSDSAPLQRSAEGV
eukprot:m.108134 g.108134  ORF g.108134 m.108134 type:complete len:133 (-) comp15330_c0_seq8:1605-2003(-)